MRFSLRTVAFSVAILVLDVGTGWSSGMTRHEVSQHARLQAAGVRFVLFHYRMKRAALEEARFQVAELLYQRKLYPQAAEFYRLLASEKGPRRQQAIQRIYEIANYWLLDTGELLKRVHDFQKPGWLTWVYSCDLLSGVLPDLRNLLQKALSCRNMLHWDDSKPFFNEEGQAIELLQCVRDSDRSGPFADKTLYLMGYVAWFHENYRHADECFSRLEKKHPDSPFYPNAVKLAIISKLMRDETEGERQRFEDARRLIFKALELPDFSEETKRNILFRCLNCVTANLVSRDFQEAEKCRLAGRFDEARSRYQRICADYPGTYDADRAKERLKTLQRK